MTACVLVLCALTAPPSAAPGGLMPPEVKPLLKVLEDRRLVEHRVRRFHKLRQEMYVWAWEHAKALQGRGEQELAEWRLEQGERHLELIKVAYVAALDRYPDSAPLLNGYGEYLYDLAGEIPEAVMSWQQATALDEDYAAPFHNLGIHYVMEGETEFALNAFEKALDLAPNDPNILYTVTQFYFQNASVVGQRYEWKPGKVYKEAMKLSKRAAEAAPDDYELVMDYARNFYGAEHFGADADWADAAEAWQAARKAAREETQRFFTWVNEGRAWAKAGRREEANRCLDQARALIPEHPSLDELVADIGAIR
jgi:tetratricopeptide (TPR) repeat protein